MNGEPTPSKNNASFQQTASHQEGNKFLLRTSFVVESESVERKNLRHMLLELNLQVNVHKRNLTFLPMSD